MSKDYLMHYIYIKNRMNVSESRLAKALNIQISIIKELKIDIRAKKMEKRDALLMEDNKFRKRNSYSHKHYWQDEAQIEQSFQLCYTYDELSADEKAIWQELEANNPRKEVA